jgi:hypothetical protein
MAFITYRRLLNVCTLPMWTFESSQVAANHCHAVNEEADEERLESPCLIPLYLKILCPLKDFLFIEVLFPSKSLFGLKG